MSPSRWSLKRAAVWGFALGGGILLIPLMLLGAALPHGPASAVGEVLAAAFGGMILFVAVAFVRNWALR